MSGTDMNAVCSNVKVLTSVDALRAKVMDDTTKEFTSAFKIYTSLRADQQDELTRDVGHPIRFMNRSCASNDHPVLVARREYCRQVLHNRLPAIDKSKGAGHTYGDVLFVGSGSYELFEYSSLPNAICHLGDCESKDSGRSELPMINAIKSAVNRTTFSRTNQGPSKKLLAQISGVESIAQLNNTLRDKGVDTGLPKVVVGKYPKTTTLVMFDSWYNYTEEGLIDLFEETEAVEMWGVCVFPYELVFPGMIQNDSYIIKFSYYLGDLSSTSQLSGKFAPIVGDTLEELRHKWKALGKSRFNIERVMVSLTYPGYANGYVHQYKRFAKFVSSPKITRGDVTLVMEIVTRASPLITFKVSRVCNEFIARTIKLLPHEEYVSVLDYEKLFKELHLSGTFTKVNGVDVRDCSRFYIPILREEWFDILAWTARANADDVNAVSICKFICNRMNGVSLVTGSKISAWKIRSEHVKKVAHVACLLIKFQEFYAQQFFNDPMNVMKLWDKFLLWLKHDSMIAPVVQKLRKMFYGLNYDEIESYIVMFPVCERFTIERAIGTSKVNEYELEVDRPCEGASCCVCDRIQEYVDTMHDKHGGKKQKWDCKNFGNNKVCVLTCEVSQYNHMAKLIDESLQKEVKPGPIVTLNNEVKTVFSSLVGDKECVVEVEYIKGGPGTGKSEFIKHYVLSNDSLSYKVMVPFRALADEYKKSKIRVDTFQTCAMSHDQFDLLIVDEFTSVALEYVVMTLCNANAKKLLLVGDTDQCWVHREEEGTPLSSCIDFEAIPCHDFIVNYRNGLDIVATINETFSKHYEFGGSIVRTVERVAFDTMPESNETMICVSREFADHGAAGHHPQIEMSDGTTVKPSTIRSVQGKTIDKAIWYVLRSDEISMKGIGLVGLTRCKERLRIACSDDVWREIRTLHKTLFDENEVELRAKVPEREVERPQKEGVIDYDEIETLLIKPSGSKILSCPQLGKNAIEVVELDDQSDVHFVKTKEVNACSFIASVKFCSVALMLKEGIVCDKGISSFEDAMEYMRKVSQDEKYKTLDFLDGKFKEWHKMLCMVLDSLNLSLSEERFVIHFGKKRDPRRVVLAEMFIENDHIDCTVYNSARRGKVVVQLLSVPTKQVFWERPVEKPCPKIVDDGHAVYLDAEQPPSKLDVFRMLRKRGLNWIQSLRTSFSSTTMVGKTQNQWDIDDAFVKEEGIEENLPANEAKDKVAYELHLETFYQDVGSNQTVEPAILPKPLDKARNFFWDGYKMAPLVLGEVLFAEGEQSLNRFGVTKCVGPFRGGKIKGKFFDFLNAKGRVKPTYDEFHSASVGQGYHFSQKNPMHELQCLSGRYLNKKETFPFDERSRALAKEIVDLYFRDCMDMQSCKFLKTDADMVWRKYLRSCREKGYDKKFQDPDLNRYLGVVQFNVKQFFKPKVGKVLDPEKVGQGVSAWDNTLQSYFCGAFRVLGDLARSCEKPHVLTDNGLSETVFSRVVREQMKDVPSIATNAITDGCMFDSQQNEFTQEVEKQFWVKLGVNRHFLDCYYKFRRHYLIKGSFISGYADNEKTSGEPATKENNGIVSKVISNAIVRGIGPFLMIYKGDDFYKRQCGQFVDEKMKLRIEQRCPLRLRIDLDASAEFCGMVAHGNGFCPSLYRRLSKVTSHRFRDYEHFAEYQDSLRAFVNEIARLGQEEVIALNAVCYNTDLDHAHTAYECLISFGHINKQQFLDYFPKRKEHFIFPYDCKGIQKYNVLD